MKPFLLTILTLTALGVVGLRVMAAVTAGPSWGGKEKRGLKTLAILVILIILFGFAPSPTGWWAFFAVVFTLFVSVGSLLMAAEFPGSNIGVLLEERTWGTNPNRPAPAFLLQAAAAGCLVLLIAVLWLFTGLSSLLAPVNPPQADDKPSTTAPARPKATPTPAQTTVAPAPSATTPPTPNQEPSVTAKGGSCPGIENILEPTRPYVQRDFYPHGVEWCSNGRWVLWNGTAPSTIIQTHRARAGVYEVVQFEWDGQAYIVRRAIAS